MSRNLEFDPESQHNNKHPTPTSFKSHIPPGRTSRVSDTLITFIVDALLELKLRGKKEKEPEVETN
tara:strand:+ start:667 stop:864 length:198 start_codon:yes stop_codon:yes gene_type:complete